MGREGAFWQECAVASAERVRDEQHVRGVDGQGSSVGVLAGRAAHKLVGGHGQDQARDEGATRGSRGRLSALRHVQAYHQQGDVCADGGRVLASHPAAPLRPRAQGVQPLRRRRRQNPDAGHLAHSALGDNDADHRSNARHQSNQLPLEPHHRHGQHHHGRHGRHNRHTVRCLQSEPTQIFVNKIVKLNRMKMQMQMKMKRRSIALRCRCCWILSSRFRATRSCSSATRIAASCWAKRRASVCVTFRSVRWPQLPQSSSSTTTTS